jgi:hypothetical protein
LRSLTRIASAPLRPAGPGPALARGGRALRTAPLLPALARRVEGSLAVRSVRPPLRPAEPAQRILEVRGPEIVAATPQQRVEPPTSGAEARRSAGDPQTAHPAAPAAPVSARQAPPPQPAARRMSPPLAPAPPAATFGGAAPRGAEALPPAAGPRPDPRRPAAADPPAPSPRPATGVAPAARVAQPPEPVAAAPTAAQRPPPPRSKTALTPTPSEPRAGVPAPAAPPVRPLARDDDREREARRDVVRAEAPAPLRAAPATPPPPPRGPTRPPPQQRIVHVHEPARPPEERRPSVSALRPARPPQVSAPPRAAPTQPQLGVAEARGTTRRTVSIEIGRIEIRTQAPRTPAPAAARRVTPARRHAIDPGLRLGGGRRW